MNQGEWLRECLGLLVSCRCAKTCTENGYVTSYPDDKWKAVEAYGVPGVENIQLEILENGES